MRVFRTMLLLGLGVLVLPTDSASQERFTAKAKSAAQWTMTFCDRNPETCVKGRDAWAVMQQKAEFGAKTAFTLISEHYGNGGTAAVQADHRTPVARARGTLQSSDLEPAWRGAPARKGG